MSVTQDYGWSQLAKRAGHDWPDGTEWAMQQARRAGMTGWEPFLETRQDADRIIRCASLQGLTIPSFFLAGPLHGEAGPTLARMTDIAARVAAFGAKLAAVYPEAVADGEKPDAQLAAQARNLTILAGQMRPLGIRLLYHPEEPEMRLAAREFHHMLARTDPDLIGLCFDPDTIWRGAGGSNLAVLDIIQLYGDRIGVVHIRQSHAGVWAETVGPGDIDYPAIAEAFAARNINPLLVVEHAYDKTTPDTLAPVTAHAQSLAFIRSTFGRI